MNWFEKHLHLTILLYIIVWFAVEIPFFGNEAALLGVGVIGGLLFLGLAAWVLRKKGQSLWFLFAVLVLWWVIFLFPNKNVVKPVVEYDYDDEPPA